MKDLGKNINFQNVATVVDPNALLNITVTPLDFRVDAHFGRFLLKGGLLLRILASPPFIKRKLIL